MIFLLDTDILIDVALKRMPHATAAGKLLDLLEQRPGTAWVAWHTLSNFHYLVSPTRGRDDTKNFLVDLARFVNVAQTTTKSFLFAARLRLKDFEDALQVAAAVACEAEIIVTRNIRDYTHSPIKAVAPQSVLHEFF